VPLVQIVVQGIPWKYDWKELKDMFQEIGSVERADVAFSSSGRSRVRGAADLRRLLARDWGCALRLQGYGTVRFTTAEAAQAAIDRFNGSTLEGRTLTVFVDKYAWAQECIGRKAMSGLLGVPSAYFTAADVSMVFLTSALDSWLY
jgi:hypothetical protein